MPNNPLRTEDLLPDGLNEESEEFLPDKPSKAKVLFDIDNKLNERRELERDEIPEDIIDPLQRLERAERHRIEEDLPDELRLTQDKKDQLDEMRKRGAIRDVIDDRTAMERAFESAYPDIARKISTLSDPSKNSITFGEGIIPEIQIDEPELDKYPQANQTHPNYFRDEGSMKLWEQGISQSLGYDEEDPGERGFFGGLYDNFRISGRSMVRSLEGMLQFTIPKMLEYSKENIPSIRWIDDEYKSPLRKAMEQADLLDEEFSLTESVRYQMEQTYERTTREYENWLHNNRELIGRDPEFQETGEKVGRFIGGLIPSMLGGLAAGATGLLLGGPPGAKAAGFLYSYTMYGGRWYKDARDAGMSPEEAEDISMMVGAITGLMGATDIGYLFRSLPGGNAVSASLTANMGKQMIKQGAVSGTVEAMQETTMRAFEDTYVEHRDWFDGIERDVLAGFTMGAMTGMGRGAVVANQKAAFENMREAIRYRDKALESMINEGKIEEAAWGKPGPPEGIEVGENIYYLTEESSSVLNARGEVVNIDGVVELEGKKYDARILNRIREETPDIIGPGSFTGKHSHKVDGQTYKDSPTEGIDYGGPTQVKINNILTADRARQELGALQNAQRWITDRASILARFSDHSERAAQWMRRATSQLTSRQERFLKNLQEYNRLGLTPEQYGEASILAERPGRLPQDITPEMSRAVELTRNILDDAKTDLINRGWLKEGFVERKTEELIRERAELVEIMDNKKYGKRYTFKTKKKLQDAINEIDAKIENVEGLNYMPIPSRILAEFLADQNQHKRSKYLTESILKKRENITLGEYIKELQEKGILDSNLDIRKIISSYWQQYSKITMVDDALQIGYEEGFVVDNIQQIPEQDRHGWTRINRRYGPWQGKYAHGMFLDTMESQLDIGKRTSASMSAARMVFSQAKFFAFYNPAIMTIYNIVQASLAGTVSRVSFPRRFRDAIHHVGNRTELYYRFYDLAGQSSPFPGMNFNMFQELVSKEISKNDYSIGQRIAERYAPSKMKDDGVRGVLGSMFRITKDVYTISYNFTWQMDAIIRMQTWLGLMEQGLSETEAAQKTALYHADYGDIPVETRRALNMVLFTPSFDISMAKLYSSMVRGVGNAFRGKADKGNWIDARALGIMSGMWAARHFVFTKLLGFEQDQLFRRYFKEVEDEEGRKQELVFTMAGPDLKLWSYFHRFRPRADEPNYFSQLQSQMKWQLHPLYQLGLDLAANEGNDFQPIYNTFDPPHAKAFKIATYSLTRTIRALEMINKDDRSREGIEIAREEVGPIFEMITKPMTFKYVRGTSDRRRAWQLHSLQSELRKDLERLDPDEDSAAIDRIVNNYIRRIERIKEQGEVNTEIPKEKEEILRKYYPN